jgi:protein SCO1/2
MRSKLIAQAFRPASTLLMTSLNAAPVTSCAIRPLFLSRCPSNRHFSSNSENNSKDEKAANSENKSKDEKAEGERPEVSETVKEKGKRPVSWGIVFATAVISVIGVTYFQNRRMKELVSHKQGRVVGRPKLGGPYSLYDTQGRKVSDTDFRGKYQLIYFGFINCPDICPTELRKLEQALEALPADVKKDVVPVFITIDPARDTKEALDKYSKKWDPSIVWLTGPLENISEVAKAFRVYFSIPEIAPGDDDDYLVDHSIFFYLMDREHKLMEIWGKNYSASVPRLAFVYVFSFFALSCITVLALNALANLNIVETRRSKSNTCTYS